MPANFTVAEFFNGIAQKRTSGAQIAMSAIPPESGHGAEFVECPLYANITGYLMPTTID